MINYKFIIKNYLYIYGVGMLLLIFVMFFGKEYYGAKVGCPSSGSVCSLLNCSSYA